MADRMEELDLIIVGAGFYGLQTAKTYLEVNPECKLLVLDSQASIGGTWAEERLYEGLQTNNIVGTFGFSDYPFRPEEWGMEHENYNPGVKVHAYFTKWAKKFGVFQRTRFNAVVESADLQDDSSWIVSYLIDLVETRVVTKKLVLATGTTWKPMVPPLQGADLFKGQIFHTRELANRAADMANAKNIAVLGGSKSAADAVYINAIKGKKVDWIVRESGKGPSWIVQSFATPLKFWFEKLTLTRLLTWFAPTPYTDDYPRARWFLHNTWLGRKVNAALWYLINDDVVATAEFKKNPDTAKLQPWSSIFWWGVQVGIFNYPTDLFAMVRDGTIKVHVGDVETLSEHKISLSNGNMLESDMLICATGWHMTPTVQITPPAAMAQISPIPHSPTDPKILKIDHEIMAQYPILQNSPSAGPSAEIEKPSYETYRGAIPPAFISTRNFAWNGMIPNLSGTLTAGIQALWITAFLDNKLDTPPESLYTPEEIKQQAVYHARFWRWKSPMGLGTMMPDMVFEVLPFVDTLLRDLGLKTNRKGGWREILEPYGSEDYAGLVQEWLSKEKKVN